MSSQEAIAKLWFKESLKANIKNIYNDLWPALGPYIAYTYIYYDVLFEANKKEHFKTINDLKKHEPIVHYNIDVLIEESLQKVMNEILEHETHFPSLIDEYVLIYEQNCQIENVPNNRINKAFFLWLTDEFRESIEDVKTFIMDDIGDNSLSFLASCYDVEAKQILETSSQFNYMINSLVNKIKEKHAENKKNDSSLNLDIIK